MHRWARKILSLIRKLWFDFMEKIKVNKRNKAGSALRIVSSNGRLGVVSWINNQNR
jgi:hypothetical protein